MLRRSVKEGQRRQEAPQHVCCAWVALALSSLLVGAFAGRASGQSLSQAPPGSAESVVVLEVPDAAPEPAPG